ncbi:hypothetical protein ZWY2020_026556 [Hordeum vulgare]|nr:hypothetical protein ZWY2020_026556 [Hordeum vulgare]
MARGAQLTAHPRPPPDPPRTGSIYVDNARRRAMSWPPLAAPARVVAAPGRAPRPRPRPLCRLTCALCQASALLSAQPPVAGEPEGNESCSNRTGEQVDKEPYPFDIVH